MPPTLIFRTERINHGQQRRPWHCRARLSLRVTRAQSPAKSPTLPVGAGISRSWQFSPCPSRKALLVARLTRRGQRLHQASSGRSSGVEHNLAKVGVEGSNPFARSNFPHQKMLQRRLSRRLLFLWARFAHTARHSVGGGKPNFLDSSAYWRISGRWRPGTH